MYVFCLIRSHRLLQNTSKTEEEKVEEKKEEKKQHDDRNVLRKIMNGYKGNSEYHFGTYKTSTQNLSASRFYKLSACEFLTVGEEGKDELDDIFDEDSDEEQQQEDSVEHAGPWCKSAQEYSPLNSEVERTMDEVTNLSRRKVMLACLGEKDTDALERLERCRPSPYGNTERWKWFDEKRKAFLQRIRYISH